MSKIVSLDTVKAPLRLVDLPVPTPEQNEILIKVKTCGVCHTELDEIEGRTLPIKLPIVPGHEVVGIVEATGNKVTKFSKGDRVGVGWIHHSTGRLDENLSPDFRATGRDANGGYAEYMTVSENYAFPIADIFSDEEAAPLLCAGAIGYRALKFTNIKDGESLGLTGFGGSAHIILKLIQHMYPYSKVYVFARDQSAREFALEQGAHWVGETTQPSPKKLNAIIDTTPAWSPIIEALGNLKPGGRLIINAIRKEDSDKVSLFNLSYHKHLWMEKEIKTIANVTHQDISEFLSYAAAIPIIPTVTSYRLEEANEALHALKFNAVKGAKVLCI